MNDVVTVEWFDDSPDAGDERCICSVCGNVIGIDDGNFPPIRVLDFINMREARFDERCWSLLRRVVNGLPH